MTIEVQLLIHFINVSMNAQRITLQRIEHGMV